MSKLQALRKAVQAPSPAPGQPAGADGDYANAVTWFGFLVVIVSAWLRRGQLFMPVGMLLAGFFDILDGALARRTTA